MFTPNFIAIDLMVPETCQPGPKSTKEAKNTCITVSRSHSAILLCYKQGDVKNKLSRDVCSCSLKCDHNRGKKIT